MKQSTEYTPLKWGVNEIGAAHFHEGATFATTPFSTPSFQSPTTARICSAALSLGFTCLRLYHGNIPSKSGVTRICPSQSGPAPIPIVGIGIRWLNSFATV